LHQVKDLAIALEPFVPHTSSAIFKQLNIAPRKWDDIGKLSLPAGHQLGKPEILFKKIETSPPSQGASASAKAAQANAKPAAAPVEPILASAIDLEVGRIISIRRHPNAEKLYVEQVLLGGGERQIVSGIVPYYKEEELVGKLVIIVKNLKPAVLRGVESRGMLLAVEEGGKLEVLSPSAAAPGDKVEVEGEPSAPLREITITQFATVNMDVKGHVAHANGKTLLVGGAPIKTEKVAEGKVK